MYNAKPELLQSRHKLYGIKGTFKAALLQRGGCTRAILKEIQKFNFKTEMAKVFVDFWSGEVR